jgi:DNA polymerase-3 subunit gamma/tau
MSYTVFARKYRPQTFADLVGQEHVTRTLSNAINQGRVAHAFLFTGVRGVGKTTSARILAKALNCEKGPTPEPCNACDACLQITQGLDLDVIEMDGASNNSVDDVRRLQESIPFRPARDRFKIVIVDEVHMLSTGAFNAFLKTLEEPPAHVKFIFATTEAHKVPVTIRSRCQRYDFRLIPQSLIATHVARVLAAESIEADEHAVALVAREAAGSMRDALTLLDQVVAFSGNKLSGVDVSRHLGIADRAHLHELCEATLGSDGKRALEVIDAVADQGLDLLHFTKQWLDLLRDMVVLSVAGDHPKLVELPAEERSRAEALARKSELLELERAFAGVAQLVEEVGRSSNPRIALEMGAVRLATRPPLRALAEVLARLEAIERGSPPSPQGPGSRGPTEAGGPKPTPQTDPRLRGAPELRPTAPSAPARPTSSPARPAPGGGASVHNFQRFIPPEAQMPGMAPAPATESPRKNQAPASVAAQAPALTLQPEPPPRAVPARALLEEVPVTKVVAPTSLPPGIDHALWVRVVSHMREHEPRWSAMYQHGVPAELGPGRVTIQFPEGSFFGRQAQSSDGSEALRRSLRAVLSADPELEVRFAAEVKGASIAQLEASLLDERKEALKKKALGHPRVVEALKIFPELSTKQDVQIDAE